VQLDEIANEEVVYRCVFFGRNLYRLEGGRLIVSSQAFADRERKPSVDRASFCGSDPSWAQMDQRDGVVSLMTGAVRELNTVVQRDSKGRETFTYKLDVEPDPIFGRPGERDSPAHARIVPHPDYRTRSAFRKVMEQLAYLANERTWEMLPADFRSL